MRPQVSVYIATSLDGFIARPNGGLDWLDRAQLPGEDYGFAAFMASVDGLLMGRDTYDIVLGFGGAWPYAGKQVVIFTHRPAESRHGERFVEGALGPVLEELGQQGVRRVYLDGGKLIRQGLAEGVVDDLTLSVLPVLLGEGIPLFGAGVPESAWTLVSARGYESGLVQSCYRR